jgi:hypothetical protein
MTLKPKTKNRHKEKNEVHGEAIAGAGIVPRVDGAGILVVTVEHSAAANIAVNAGTGSSVQNDNCHLRAVIMCTSTV